MCPSANHGARRTFELGELAVDGCSRVNDLGHMLDHGGARGVRIINVPPVFCPNMTYPIATMGAKVLSVLQTNRPGRKMVVRMNNFREYAKHGIPTQGVDGKLTRF